MHGIEIHIWSAVQEDLKSAVATIGNLEPLKNRQSPLSEAAVARPHKETSDVFSPKYWASTLLRIRFSAGVIINTSSNIRLYTALAMRLLGMCPNMTHLWY